MTGRPGRPRALVVGLGVGGIAAATRLHETGWDTVVVERAGARRSGGYFVGLFGSGRSAARRLGFLDDLHDRASGGPHDELDRQGRTSPGMAFSDLPGNPWLMLRSDIEQAAFARLPAEVDVRFATTPTAITQDDDGVDVRLTPTAYTSPALPVTERFDLVVGADGLRSTVRALVFGPDRHYLRRLDHIVVAYAFPGTPSGLAPGQGATLIEVGRSMWVFAYADRDPTVLLSYRTHDVDAEFTGPPAERLRQVFGPEPLGSTLGSVLDALGSADDVLFDSAEQVRMPRWSHGRVVLVGDAAWCPTAYAGTGVSAALAAADLLATALSADGDDVHRALRRWERALRPFIDRHQRAGIDQRRFFTPGDAREARRRRRVTELVTSPVVGPALVRIADLRPAARVKDVDIAAAAAVEWSPRSRWPAVRSRRRRAR